MPPLPRSSSPNRLRPRMRPQRTPDCTGGLAADGVSAAPDWLGLELGPGIADPQIERGGDAGTRGEHGRRATERREQPRRAVARTAQRLFTGLQRRVELCRVLVA